MGSKQRFTLYALGIVGAFIAVMAVIGAVAGA